MKKKKRYVVILVVLVVFTIVMYLALGRENIAKGKRTTTIIIGDNTIWNYSNNSWLNITSETTIDEISWLDYNVYIDNKELGKYYLWYGDDKWYIFDNNKKSVTRNGAIIAYRSNYDVKIKDFTTENIRNYYHVEKVLEQNELSTSSKFTVTTETSLDIDNDGSNEKFYFVSNAFPLEFTPSEIFSLVFMVKNNEIYPIYTDITKNISNDGCKPYLSAVIDIDEDNIYEMVVSCGKYSVEKPVDMLYKLTDEGFKILISNQ